MNSGTHDCGQLRAPLHKKMLLYQWKYGLGCWIEHLELMSVINMGLGKVKHVLFKYNEN